MAARGDSQTHEETVLLMELWRDDHVQQQLDTTPKRNIDIFRRVCQDIKDRLPEFCRSAEDCQARIKRLKTQYFQIKRQNKKSGGKRKCSVDENRNISLHKQLSRSYLLLVQMQCKRIGFIQFDRDRFTCFKCKSKWL